MTVFTELFEESFIAIYNWTTQNLKLLMPVLQCNVVRQMLDILEGLIPVRPDDDQQTAESVKDSIDGEIALKFLEATKLILNC